MLEFDAAGARPDVEDWTLGRRDAALARIYAALYGEGVDATVRCTGCDALLEFETTIAALFADVPDEWVQPGSFCLRHDGYAVTLRPVRVGDVLALPATPAAAVETVLRRCVIGAQRDAVPVAPEALPAGVRDAVSTALNAADPNGDILVSLSCGECGTALSVPFDIGTFLWEALERSALQTLTDVHILAAAYGWSERDILAMPENRRRRYLEFVR